MVDYLASNLPGINVEYSQPWLKQRWTMHRSHLTPVYVVWIWVPVRSRIYILTYPIWTENNKNEREWILCLVFYHLLRMLIAHVPSESDQSNEPLKNDKYVLSELIKTEIKLPSVMVGPYQTPIRVCFTVRTEHESPVIIIILN